MNTEVFDATVTSDDPCEVRTDPAGSSSPAVPYEHYTPNVGDRVTVLRMGTTLRVLGKLP